MSRYRGPRVKIIRRLGSLPGLTGKTPNQNLVILIDQHLTKNYLNIVFD